MASVPAKTRKRLTAQTGSARSVVSHAVDWRTYCRLSRALENHPGVRLTYDQGDLEIISPILFGHEAYKRVLGRLVSTLTEELRLPIAEGGSTTCRRASMRIRTRSAGACTACARRRSRSAASTAITSSHGRCATPGASQKFCTALVKYLEVPSAIRASGYAPKRRACAYLDREDIGGKLVAGMKPGKEPLTRTFSIPVAGIDEGYYEATLRIIVIGEIGDADSLLEQMKSE